MDQRIINKVFSQYQRGKRIFFLDRPLHASTVQIPHGGPFGWGTVRYDTDQETIRKIKKMIKLASD